MYMLWHLAGQAVDVVLAAAVVELLGADAQSVANAWSIVAIARDNWTTRLAAELVDEIGECAAPGGEAIRSACAERGVHDAAAIRKVVEGARVGNVHGVLARAMFDSCA